MICNHKDCERTDATPVYIDTAGAGRARLRTSAPTTSVLSTGSSSFALEKSRKALPPEEWFAPGFVPDVRP